MDSVITILLIATSFYFIYKTQKQLTGSISTELVEVKKPSRELIEQRTPLTNENLPIVQDKASVANNLNTSWSVIHSTTYNNGKNNLIVSTAKDRLVSPLFDPRNFRRGVTPFLNSK